MHTLERVRSPFISSILSYTETKRKISHRRGLLSSCFGCRHTFVLSRAWVSSAPSARQEDKSSHNSQHQSWSAATSIKGTNDSGHVNESSRKPAAARLWIQRKTIRRWSSGCRHWYLHQPIRCIMWPREIVLYTWWVMNRISVLNLEQYMELALTSTLCFC